MTVRPPIRLSKSRILSGLQCHRRLWLETYQREQAEIAPGQQAIFDAGHELGDLARSLYGPGVLIEHVHEIRKALAETSAILARPGRRSRLFEAAFKRENVVARADVLRPVAGGHELIEVKGSASVKDYYIDDCASQAWVIEGAGIPLTRIRLAHVDSAFVYQGKRDYRGLLHAEDVTAAVRERMREVPGWVSTMKGMLRGGEPDIKTGVHCDKPYPCPFFAHCSSKEPPRPEFPVGILPRGGRLTEALLADGYTDLRDVPARRLEKPLHKRVRKATVTGRRFLDSAVRLLLAKYSYPRYYLDFESIGFTIPRWKGTRPFQQIPFQWSCHIERRDGSLEHQGFLDLSGNAPIGSFVESLLATLGKRGPIFVYSGFESVRVRELAAMVPQKAESLLALTRRMVDLLPITREHYYHPAMKGSWSIKDVLPTIAPELSYEFLDEVADGGGAQLAYREAIHPETASTRRSTIEGALTRYCANDTLGMVKLVAVLSD